MGSACGTYGREEEYEHGSNAKPEWKRPRGSTRRPQDKIKMGFKETRWKGVDWIRLAQETDEWQNGRNH
jgi:hypothetical protein